MVTPYDLRKKARRQASDLLSTLKMLAASDVDLFRVDDDDYYKEQSRLDNLIVIVEQLACLVDEVGGHDTNRWKLLMHNLQLEATAGCAYIYKGKKKYKPGQKLAPAKEVELQQMLRQTACAIQAARDDYLKPESGSYANLCILGAIVYLVGFAIPAIDEGTSDDWKNSLHLLSSSVRDLWETQYQKN